MLSARCSGLLGGCKVHCCFAIKAHYEYIFCCSATVATFGADVFTDVVLFGTVFEYDFAVQVEFFGDAFLLELFDGIGVKFGVCIAVFF